MNTVIIIFSTALGLIIGSFLNVVLCRYNTGRGLKGRSCCFACSKQLAWFELVPLASFVVQKGKCRGCQTNISWQYPSVEILTGVLFGLMAWSLTSAWDFYFDFWFVLTLLTSFVALSFLVLIAVYDLKHKIIPDEWVVGVGVTGLVMPFVSDKGFGYVVFNLGNKVIAAIVLGGFFYLIWHFTKGKAMGFGDVKLATAMGLLAGLVNGVAGIVFAFWIGAVVGLSLIALSRSKKLASSKLVTMKSEIPFAPFIVAGVILSMLINFNASLF
jgi:prepilin signal peptidase PulO-like enzyme (type II secretory pathway)